MDPNLTKSQLAMLAAKSARYDPTSIQRFDKTLARARYVLAYGTEAEIAAVNAGNLTVRRAESLIRLRNKNGARRPGNNNRDYPVRIPPGTTAEAIVRAGIILEETGMAKTAVANKLKIGGFTYRRLREIIILHDRAAGLSMKDREAVEAAFTALATPNAINLNKIYDSVAHISARMWAQPHSSRDNKWVEERIEEFAIAMDRVAGTCGCIPKIPVPYLSRAMAEEKMKLLRTAQKDLGTLIIKLREFTRDPV